MITTDNIFSKSLLAGLAIGIGGYLFLTSLSYVLGSILFSVGLISVCIFKLNLFTGKSGFITDINDLRRVILVLLLNVFAAFVFGLITRYLNSNIVEAANFVLTNRLNTDFLAVPIKALITGFLMTLAIESINKQTTNYLVLILCVIAFVYTKCFHSIADSFYYGASSLFMEHPGELLLKLFIVIIFNFIGCNLYNLFVYKSFIHKEQ